MWVELPEGVDVAELEKAAAEREVAVRQGHRLPARGRPEHAAPGLLGRDAGADRRGHHQARRGAPLPGCRSVHNYGDDPSQYGVLYGEGPVAVLIHGGFWKRSLRPDADGRRLPRTSPRAAGRRGTSSTGGWATAAACPMTLDDVSAAIDHLADARQRRPARRVVAIGHSAGGHLAAVGRDARGSARVASPASSPRRACWTCSGAASCGCPTTSSTRVPGREHPMRRSPRRSSGSRSAVPALLTHGGLDDIVPVEISTRFAEASRRDADRRTRRGPLRPPRPGQPALEGGARHGS